MISQHYLSETFKKSAEYNCEWATSTTVPLLDQLWIYSGILSRVPQLVEVSEQSQQKIKNNANKVINSYPWIFGTVTQRHLAPIRAIPYQINFKVGNGTPEHRELEAKGNTVNGVILSEADYLDQIRIPDYSKLMKNYLKSRGWFLKKNYWVLREKWSQAMKTYREWERALFFSQCLYLSASG